MWGAFIVTIGYRETFLVLLGAATFAAEINCPTLHLIGCILHPSIKHLHVLHVVLLLKHVVHLVLSTVLVGKLVRLRLCADDVVGHPPLISNHITLCSSETSPPGPLGSLLIHIILQYIHICILLHLFTVIGDLQHLGDDPHTFHAIKFGELNLGLEGERF